MNRRDALERVALILGGTVIGGAAFLQGCKNTTEKAASFFLSQDQIAFLDEVAETIIPSTDTPGAKAALVGAFMNTMVMDCYKEKDQKIFAAGITEIDNSSNHLFGNVLLALMTWSSLDSTVAFY